MSRPGSASRSGDDILAQLKGEAEAADAAWESLIGEVHRVTPGCTSLGLRQALDPSGRSSYDVLAATVLPGTESVLDLACGDGEMFTRLRRLGCARVLGIDRSRRELLLARSKADIAAAVVAGDARCLPVRQCTQDAVVCHMALMLFDDLPAVLAEVGRVLRHSGTFAAVVQAAPGQGAARLSAAAAECGLAMRSWWQRSIGDLPDTRAGLAFRQHGSLNAAFAQAALSQPRWEPVTVTLHAAPDQIWTDYLANLYLVRALTAPVRRGLRDAAIGALSGHSGSDGRVTFDISLSLLAARKGPGASQ